MVQNTGSMVISQRRKTEEKKKSWKTRTVWSFSTKVNIGDMEAILGLKPTNQRSTEGNWNFAFTYSWSTGTCAWLLLYFVLYFTQAGPPLPRSNVRAEQHQPRVPHQQAHRHAEFLAEATVTRQWPLYVLFFSFFGESPMFINNSETFYNREGRISPFPSNISKNQVRNHLD